LNSTTNQALGNLGGIVASNIFIKSQSPKYPVGFGAAAGFLGVTIIASCIFIVGLYFENKKRDAGGRDYRYEEPQTELENMGDDYPTFRFSY